MTKPTDTLFSRPPGAWHVASDDGRRITLEALLPDADDDAVTACATTLIADLIARRDAEESKGRTLGFRISSAHKPDDANGRNHRVEIFNALLKASGFLDQEDKPTLH